MKSIGALDKDFQPMIKKLTQLAVILPNLYEAKLTNLAPENDPHHIFENAVNQTMEQLGEDFLDAVFGPESSLTKEEYIEKLG